MSTHIKKSQLHLLSGICFMLASLIFLVLAFQSVESQQVVKLIAGGLFALNAFLQFLVYSRKKTSQQTKGR